MRGYNPDLHGYWYEHEDTCDLRVHGGDGDNCDCTYRHTAIAQAKRIIESFNPNNKVLMDSDNVRSKAGKPD